MRGSAHFERYTWKGRLVGDVFCNSVTLFVIFNGSAWVAQAKPYNPSLPGGSVFQWTARMLPFLLMRGVFHYSHDRQKSANGRCFFHIESIFTCWLNLEQNWLVTCKYNFSETCVISAWYVACYWIFSIEQKRVSCVRNDLSLDFVLRIKVKLRFSFICCSQPFNNWCVRRHTLLCES